MDDNEDGLQRFLRTQSVGRVSHDNSSAGAGYVPSEATTEQEYTVRVSSFTSNGTRGIHHGQASLNGHGHGLRNVAMCPEHGRALCQFSSACCVHKPVDCTYCPAPRSCCCIHHAGDCCYCVVPSSFSRQTVSANSSGESGSSDSDSSDDTSSSSCVETSDETTARGSVQGSSHGSVEGSVQGGFIPGASAQGSVQSEVYKPEPYDQAQAQPYYQGRLEAQQLAHDSHSQVHQAGDQAQGQSLSQLFGQLNGQVQYPVQGPVYQAQVEAQQPAEQLSQSTQAQSESQCQSFGQPNDQAYCPVEQIHYQAQHFAEGSDQNNVQHLPKDHSHGQTGDHTQQGQYQTQNLTKDRADGQESHEQDPTASHEEHNQVQQTGDQAQAKSQNEKLGRFQWADEVEEELAQLQETNNAHDLVQRAENDTRHHHQSQTEVTTHDHAQDQSLTEGNSRLQWADEVEEYLSKGQSQDDKVDQVQQMDSQSHKDQLDDKGQNYANKDVEDHAQGNQDQGQDNSAQPVQPAQPEDQPQEHTLDLAMGQPQSHVHVQTGTQAQDETQHKAEQQPEQQQQKTSNQAEINARNQIEDDQSQASSRALTTYTLKLLETGNYSDSRLIIQMPMNNLYPIPFPTHKVLLSRSARLASLLSANSDTGDIEATTGETFSMIKAFETALQNLYGAPYLTPQHLKVATADALGYELAADKFETLIMSADLTIHEAMADYAMCYLASGVFLGELGVVEAALKLAIHAVHPDNVEALLAFVLQPGRVLFRSPTATVTAEAATLAANREIGLDERLAELARTALVRLFGPLGVPFKLYISARPTRTAMFPDRIPASLRMYPGSILANPKLAEVKFGSFASVAESRPAPEVERASGVLLALSFEMLKIAFVVLDERGLLTEEVARAVVVEREARRFYALRVYAMFRARCDTELKQFGKKRSKKLKKDNGIKDDEIKVLGYREAIVLKDEKVSLVRDWVGLEAP